MKQIRYAHYLKFLFPTIGLLILFFFFYRPNNINPNISIWDYEGFSITKFCSLLVGMILLFDGLYLFYKNNSIQFRSHKLFIPSFKLIIPYHEVSHVTNAYRIYTLHTSKGDFNIVNLFVKNQREIEKMMFEELKFKQVKKSKGRLYLYLATMLFAILGMIIFQFWKPGEQKLKTFLPLKKIETTQIEGTIKNKGTISFYEMEERGRWTSVSFHGGLKEFPNIYFKYEYDGLGYSLPDNIVNITNADSEKMAASNLERTKTQRLLKGTKVKLKIRTKDYEDLLSYLASGEHLIKKEKFDTRRSVRIYELSVDDVIVLQKFGLE